MKTRTSTLILTTALIAASLALAACDGTAAAAQDAGLAKPPAEQAPASSGETALVRLSSALQVFELVGPADSISPEEWTVAGVTFATGKGTEIEGELSAGDLVKVEIALQADGQLFARAIRRAISAAAPEGVGELEFVGTLEAVGDTQWTVNGLTLQVGPGTELMPGMQAGDLVKVHALIGEGGVLTAREIEKAEDEAEDSQEPVGEFEFAGTVESMGADSWTVGGRTLAIAPGTEVKGSIEVGSLVKVHVVPQADGSLLAREIEPAGVEDMSDDSGTPESGEDGEDFKFSGIVESIGEGSWTIGGMTFSVTGATEFDSHILVGDMVQVELVRNADGSLTAKEIEEDNDGLSFDDDDLNNHNSGSGSDDHSADDNGGSGSDDNSGKGSGSGGDDD